MNMQKLCKSGVKRAFALVLTVCMLLSILPASVITAPSGVKVRAASEHDMYFDMLKGRTSTTIPTSKEGLKTVTYANTTVGGGAEAGELNTDITGTDPWQTLSVFPATPTSGNTYVGFTSAANLIICAYHHNDLPAGIRFRIKAKETGYYLPYISFNRNSAGTKASTSVYKYDASAADGLGEQIVADTLIDVGKNTNNTTSATVTGNPIKLEKDTEYVVEVAATQLTFFNSNNPDWSNQVLLKGYGFSYMGATDTTLNVSATMDTPVNVGATQKLPLTISAKDNSDVDYNNMSVEVEYSDKQIATVGISVNDEKTAATLDVTGVSFGSTKARVIVKAGNYSGELELNIGVRNESEPAGANLHYSLVKGNTVHNSSIFPDSLPAVSYDMTTVGSATEINPEITAPDGTDMTPWAYFAQTRDRTNVNNIIRYAYSAVSGHRTYNANYCGIAMHASTLPMSIQLKTQVPATGWYNMSIDAFFGKKITAAIYKYDALTGTKGEAVLAATTITPAATGLGTLDVNATPFKLTAGEYIVELALAENGAYTYFRGYTFEYVGGDEPLLNIEGEIPGTMTVGQEVTIPLTLSKSNESAVDYANMTTAVSYTDKDIVTAEVVKTDSVASLKLTAAKFGSTEISVNLQDGQFKGTKTFRVVSRYAAGAQPAGKNLYYDMLKAYSGDTGYTYITSVTYNMTTAGATGEVTTLNKTSDPWAFFSRTPESDSSYYAGTYIKYNSSGYGLSFYEENEDRLNANSLIARLKIQVPTSGYYSPSVTVWPYKSGSADVTVYKYDALANKLGAVQVPAKAVSTAEGSAATQLLTDELIWFDSGEYVVEFSATKYANLTVLNGIGLTFIGDKPIVFNAAPQSSTATVVQNKSVDMPLNITYTEDGVPVDYDYTNATVEFSYSTADIAEATANKTADGISLSIAGKALGTTTVTTTVKAGTWKSSFDVLVTVDDGKPKDLYFNTYKIFTNTDASKDGGYIDTIKYSHTTSGSADEINKGIFSSDPWEFHSKTVDSGSGGYIKFNGYGYGLYFYRQSTLNLRVKVGAPGYYRADVLFDSNTPNNTMKAALLKYNSENGEIGDVIAETAAVNTQVEANGKAKILAPLGDEALLLDQGEYILRVTQPTAGNIRGALEGFSLKAVKLMPEAPASIRIGETAEIPAFRGVKLACDTLAATAAENGIVSVEVDKATGVIKLIGVAAGETDLTVTAEGDLGGSYTIPVKVIDPENAAAKSVYYDFVKANTYSDAYVPANVIDSYNMTAVGATDEIGAGAENKFGAKSGTWKYFSWYKDSYTDTKYGWTSAGKGIYTYRRINSLVKIIVPETGMYQIISNHNTSANGGTVKFTLYELNSMGTLGNATELGTVNTASATTETAFPSVVSLEAGEYVIDMELTTDKTPTVIDGILLKAPDVASSAQAAAVIRGESITHPVSIESDADAVRANVSQSNDIAEITPIIEGGELKLQIEGEVNGETIVTYEAYMSDGSFGVGSFKLFVNPAGVVVAEDLRFDYHKLNVYRDNGDTDDKHKGVDVTTVTDMSMTTEGSANEINPNSTVVTEPWCYVSDTGSQLRYASYDYGMIFDYEPATMVFKIRVKNDGLYRAFSEHLVFSSGAKVKLWLAPDGAANTTADEYYLGEVDTYSDAQQNAYQQGLKIRQLTAGDYTLTYKMEGKNEAVRSNGRFGVGAFILKGMGSHTVLTASVDGADMIPVGVEEPFTLTAYETDGLNGAAASVDVSVSMSNPIATCVVEQNEDKTETAIKITGNSTGNTVISVLVAANGVEETVTVPVTVYDGQAVVGSGTEYNYSFSKTMTGGMNVVEVDSFSKMMEGSPDEIRPNNGIDTQPWKFEFSQATAFYAPDGSQDSYGVCMGTGNGSAAGIRIRLPASGIYTPVVPYMSGDQCSTFRTYIAPADAEDPMADEYSVGTWNPFAATSVMQEAVFRSLYLEAGEYIVSWKLIAEDPAILEPGKGRIWYSGIKLKAMDSYPEITVTPDAALPAIKLGNSASVKLSASVADGAKEDFIAAEFKVDDAYADKASAVAVINSDGTASLEVTGLAVGSYNLGLTLILNGAERAKFTIPVNVTEPGELASVQPKLAENEDNTIIRRATAESLGHIVFDMLDTDGDAISALSAELQNVVYTYTSADESIAKVSADGVITPISDGEVTITCSATIAGITKYGDMVLTIVPGKARRSFYTEEKLAAARENASKYAWARSTVVAAENAAKKYLDMEEFLWNVVTTNEIPRSYYVGYRADPQSGYCRYCGENIEKLTGVTYPWKVDPVNSPWKVQCPSCRRKFPSNDFASFYQLGIQDNGKWSYELAKAKNQELEEMGHGGYLVNKDYTEMGAGWGVDDGYGYDTGNITANGVKEVHTYISYYNHWAIWHANGIVYSALDALKNAYLYTGDAKYGRVGAILLDRIADVYPEQDTRPYRWQMTADASYAPHGKSVDLIWENQNARDYCKAYDAFYPMYTDDKVISFLSRKAAQYGMENTKSNANMIRENIEDGIIRETYKAACEGSINGNFGMTQSAVAAAAVVLDTMPETRQWLDWVFQDGVQNILYPDSKQADLVTGGNVMRQIIDLVDRDGIADEVAPNYANIWIGGMNLLLEAVEGYDRYPSSNLYNNSRFVKMLSGMHPLTMSRYSTVQIGDSGSVGGMDRQVSASRAQPAWKNTGKTEFAQMLYFLNGNTTKDLRYDIFTRDPQRLAAEVQQVIDTYGEYDFDKSEMLGGYGLAMLRDGTSISSVSGGVDTQSTFWMSFARYSGHGHYDKLNLGIEAYGANIAPELGYPQKVIDDIYYNWGKATVAHNTVVVDDSHQNGIRVVGNPLHFDDSGMVKVMDAEANNEYGTKLEKYRRSVVTVNIDEETNYAVDFFRVKGGSEHVYSFHALSTVKPEIGVNGGDTISPTPQTDGNGYVGTYADRSVFFQTENVSSGYSYLRNVDRAANPGNEVYVNFKIDNSIRKQISSDRDVYLKLTMLNNFDLSELALAEGKPAEANGNPSHLEFMLARRSAPEGGTLDSLFTTVIEPYDKVSNISKMEQVPVALADGTLVDSADVKAVKVTLTNERVDYIVYAENNATEYLVDYAQDGSYKFAFQGFVGVYSEQDDKNIYSYINDGTKIGTLTGTAEITGTVSDFTRELTDENSITVSIEGESEINVSDLVGNYIYVDGCADGNGAYEILGAIDNLDGTATLDIGDITLISSLVDAVDGVYTYNYNIPDGNPAFRIPLATATKNNPIITPVADASATAGKRFTKQISAVSPIEKRVTYEAVELPRGASLNETTGEITWTPDEKQIGTNVIGVRATDGSLTSTVYFSVDVVRAAGSVTDDSSSSDSGNDSTDTGNSGTGTPDSGSGTGSGSGSGAGGGSGSTSGGGGAGGGGSSGTGSGDNTDVGDDVPSSGGDTAGDGDNTDVPSERFIDLAGYDWAKDAINNLADAGIINGTSVNTYSPGRDITRADFAVLMVRAFGLESDSTENFADVNANAYYAKDLAVAKAHGIVNGVGENRYNPTATITRQDMMTIVSRALAALGYELNEAGAEALAAYADAAMVSDYAAEHVARLIANEIVKGSNGRINPKSNTTRAEVAVLIERLVNAFIGK